MSSLRAWLTGRPKSSRATILAYWLSGNVMVVVLRRVPKEPTITILNWVIGGLVLLLAIYSSACLVINRRRRK